MRRALQTAIHMFKGHPNVSKITFVVVPQCHEFMHTSNDLPEDYTKIVSDYAPGKVLCEGLKFDFTLLLHYGEPQLWSVLSMTNTEKVGKVLSKLKKWIFVRRFQKCDARDLFIGRF